MKSHESYAQKLYSKNRVKPTKTEKDEGWFDYDGRKELENGVYQIFNDDIQYDPELPPGHIELYIHPIRGQSYWDHMSDDGSDFAGHVSPFYLGTCRLKKISNPKF